MPRQRQTSLGSGVIVSPDGYVLTNQHVVDGADDIELVLQDGRRLKAKIRGSDPESDLAVLKADAAGLPAITLGSIEHVQVGDAVLAIGNPFGFGNSVTSGIVSALGRNHLGINRFEDFIQTDAAINPGNSGGALIDASGNLIGINSTIFSQSGGSLGIGFAIPVSIARTVLEQIIKNGEVTRGWFGVEPQDVSEEIAKALAYDGTGGVVIRGLVKNGPADRAGMQVKGHRRRHRRQADRRHAGHAVADRRAASRNRRPREAVARPQGAGGRRHRRQAAAGDRSLEGLVAIPTIVFVGLARAL